jgi:putative colanic acid biosynthesis acetyltransferase WcaF
VAWTILFRPSPRIFNGWRRTLLRFFGGRIGRGVVLRPSARIWAPWNLEMGPYSTLGDQVDCYSVDAIRIGAYATVSQYGFLCASSHDPDSPDMTLTTAPIVIGDHALAGRGRVHRARRGHQRRRGGRRAIARVQGCSVMDDCGGKPRADH